MPTFKIACPHCRTTLQTASAPPPGSRIRCPKCGEVFALAGARPTKPAAPARQPAAATPQSSARPRTQPTENDWDDDEQEQPRKKRKSRDKSPSNAMPMMIVGLVVLGFIIVLGVIVVIALMSNMDNKDKQAGNKPSDVTATTPRGNAGARGRGNNRNGMDQMDPAMMQRMMGNFAQFAADPAHEEKLGEPIPVGDQFTIRMLKGFNTAPTQGGTGQVYAWVGSQESGIPGGSIAVQIHNAAGGNPIEIVRQNAENFYAGLIKGAGLENANRGEVEMGRLGEKIATRIQYTGLHTATKKNVKGVIYVTMDGDKVIFLSGVAPEDAGDSAVGAITCSLLSIRKK